MMAGINKCIIRKNTLKDKCVGICVKINVEVIQLCQICKQLSVSM